MIVGSTFVEKFKGSSGLFVSRLFTNQFITADGVIDPLEAGEWVSVDSVIRHESTGDVVCEMKGVSAPASWGQLSVDIAASKYFRKAGVPGSGYENSVAQMVRRVALAVRSAGERQGYFASVEDAEVFEDELAHLLVTQRAAFNSPVWFNCGLAEAYGITGDPAGNYCWDPETDEIVPTTDSYTRPQVSACFIQSIQDDLMDIAEHVKREMRIFKYGSGAGANFSALRARGEKLSNGGESSGVMSFLEVFDRAAGAIKSGGTTRRAAKMVVLDVEHPDIEEFIDWKVREEDKIRALVAAGFSPGMNGEAARTVGGQNANNSVRVTDKFMNAVMHDDVYDTYYRTSRDLCSTKSARGIMRKIAEATWRCADPGMQYDTTINKWHTCADTSRINASNPCSEYMYVDDSACNLASLNLVKFDDGSKFDIEGFKHAVRIVFMAQEILVDHASYPTAEIARNSHEHRPLGIGYANLGAMLMRRGIPYDSDAGRALAALVTSLMTAVAYETSAEMASVAGPFLAFAHNRDSMLRVMEMHRDYGNRIQFPDTAAQLVRDHADLFAEQSMAWDRAVTSGRQYGYRNAQASLLAPTGTIGLLMGCDTTGIEPDYALVKTKKLAGGGVVKIANGSVEVALDNLGYSQESVKEIMAYVEKHETIEGAPGLMSEHLAVFDCATLCGKTGTRFISPLGHVRMMEVVQPFLSGAISKTVNVPSATTVEEIEKLYIEGWRRGLKALAIYRADSKACQVLSGGGPAKGTDGHVRKRVRLPKKRGGFTQEARVGGQKVYVRTGEYEDGALGEVFLDMHKEGATMRSMTNCFAIAMSIGLQFGVPLEEFVNAFIFSNFSPNGTVQYHPNIKHASSIIDYVMRVLALEYLGWTDVVQVAPEPGDDVPTKPTSTGVQAVTKHDDSKPCNVCGNLATRQNGTCYVCDLCGTQTGCA